TTPSRANRSPAYQGTAPDPLTNAPPWIQPATGRADSTTSGVQTLRLRHSSPGMIGSGRSASVGGEYGPCSAVGPNELASRTPSQAAWRCGAPKRLAPKGEAA